MLVVQRTAGSSACARQGSPRDKVALAPSREGRRGYIRARLMRDAETSDYLVEGIGAATGAPAHLLAGLAEANALIRVPEEVTEIRPGDIVDVLFLAQGS